MDREQIILKGGDECQSEDLEIREVRILTQLCPSWRVASEVVKAFVFLLVVSIWLECFQRTQSWVVDVVDVTLILEQWVVARSVHGVSDRLRRPHDPVERS